MILDQDLRNAYKELLNINTKILQKQTEYRNLKAKTEISKLREDKQVYEEALAHEHEILECREK